MTTTIYCFMRVSFLLQSVHQQIRMDQEKLKKEKPFKIGGRLGVQPYVKAMKTCSSQEIHAWSLSMRLYETVSSSSASTKAVAAFLFKPSTAMVERRTEGAMNSCTFGERPLRAQNSGTLASVRLAPSSGCKGGVLLSQNCETGGH